MTTDREDDRYFGACPTCGRHDGYVNVERDHYFLCERHKVYWPAGWNLFSSWQDETPALWQKNRELLDSYTRVEPIQDGDTLVN